MFLLIKFTLLYAVVLMLVAMGGMFSERSGVINIALEGIMAIGGLAGVFVLVLFPDLPAPALVALSILASAVSGMIYSLLLGFSAITLKADQTIGGTALNMLATAIAIGGPGAIFWMWVIALLGASSAFIESTLGQLYKIRGKDSFIGGPAYYMKKGLKQPWMGMLFAILISITFGFAFNSVQSNTICAAAEHAFGVNHIILGGVLTLLTLVIIFGGCLLYTSPSPRD